MECILLYLYIPPHLVRDITASFTIVSIEECPQWLQNIPSACRVAGGKQDGHNKPRHYSLHIGVAGG
jgi:hypothetical protein